MLATLFHQLSEKLNIFIVNVLIDICSWSNYITNTSPSPVLSLLLQSTYSEVRLRAAAEAVSGSFGWKKNLIKYISQRIFMRNSEPSSHTAQRGSSCRRAQRPLWTHTLHPGHASSSPRSRCLRNLQVAPSSLTRVDSWGCLLLISRGLGSAEGVSDCGWDPATLEAWKMNLLR